MFSTPPPSFQTLQAGIPPTANPVQMDPQNPKKSPFIQQSSLLPPPSHYPGIKLGLPLVPQGTIISPTPLPPPPPPTTVKTFRRGPPVAETYLSSNTSGSSVSGQSSTSAPATLFEKHGICHSLSYITYLKSIAAEPVQDDTPESSPSPPLEHSKKSRAVHKRHRKMSKIKRSIRSKIVSPNGDIDVNYSSSCPSSPDGSGNEDSNNLDLFDLETEDTLDKALSKNPEDFFFSNEFLENKGVYDEKPNYDLLRDCRILTDEEVARRRHEKNMRLSELYRNELMHLRDIIRVRHRRFFLRQVVKDNEKARLKRKALLSSAPNQYSNGTNTPSEMETEKSLTGSSNSNQLPTTTSDLDILNDPKQKLFKGCVFKSSNGTVCNQPILVSQNPSLCPIHADLAGSTSLLEPCNVNVAIHSISKPLSIPTGNAKNNTEIFKRISGLVSMIQSRRHRLWQDDKRTSKFTVRAAAQMNNGNLNNPIDNTNETKDSENKQ